MTFEENFLYKDKEKDSKTMKPVGVDVGFQKNSPGIED